MKNPIASVVGKKEGGIEADISRPRQRRRVDKRARGILGGAGPAVRAVGICGQRGDARRPRERDRERERVFLIRSAAAFAAQRDGELTPPTG